MRNRSDLGSRYKFNIIWGAMSGNNKKISSLVLINLLLAIVALGKDVLLAGYLGTSAQADAFLLANFIVFAIGNNLLASALGVAVIPVLADLHESGEHKRFNNVTFFIIVSTIFISILLALFMFALRFKLFSYGSSGLSWHSRNLSIDLFTLLIPLVIAFPLANIGMSILQVHSRFNIPAFGPVSFNSVLLIGLIFLQYFNIPLAIGVFDIVQLVVFGVIVMLFLVWFPIFQDRLVRLPESISIKKFLLADKLNESSGRRLSVDIVTVWKSFFPYLLTILFPQIIFMVERYLASNLETGSISGLNYAFRLVQFPLWVFIAAVSTVLFPEMAKMSAMGDKQGYNNVLTNSIYVTSLFTIPFTIILYILRMPIISILLQRGEFNSHSVDITSNIIAGYAFTIIWQGFSVIWVRASIVEGKVSYALIAAAVSAVSNISFDFMIVPILGATGLGYGAAIGAMVNFGVIYMLFARLSNLHFSILWRRVYKILLANIPLYLITVLFSHLWVSVAKSGTTISRFGYVVVVIIVCSSIYWIALRLFKVRVT